MMKLCTRLAAVVLCSMAMLGAARAQDAPQLSADQRAMLVSNLKWETGAISLKDGLATIHLTPNFRFLGAADAQKVLHNLWRNPADPSVLGLIFPADSGPLDLDGWAIAVQYEDPGYIKDDDAGKIDYAGLLKQMQQGTRDANGERQRLGYPPVELVGWATPPRYDATTHKLYWAKDIRFANESTDTLNYNIRILGRRGVLLLNAIAQMPQLPEIESKTPEVLAMVNFDAGNRYSDFNPSMDKVAKYGLATLIAGGAVGAAAKLGLLKFLWPVILGLKKFLVLIVVAVVGFFRKIMAGMGRPKRVSLPGSSQPSPPPELPR